MQSWEIGGLVGPDDSYGNCSTHECHKLNLLPHLLPFAWSQAFEASGSLICKPRIIFAYINGSLISSFFFYADILEIVKIKEVQRC